MRRGALVAPCCPSLRERIGHEVSNRRIRRALRVLLGEDANDRCRGAHFIPVVVNKASAVRHRDVPTDGGARRGAELRSPSRLPALRPRSHSQRRDRASDSSRRIPSWCTFRMAPIRNRAHRVLHGEPTRSLEKHRSFVCSILLSPLSPSRQRAVRKHHHTGRHSIVVTNFGDLGLRRAAASMLRWNCRGRALVALYKERAVRVWYTRMLGFGSPSLLSGADFRRRSDPPLRSM
jgi:hypothetical protein